MDAKLNKNKTIILTVIIAATTIILLLHTDAFSVGLLFLSCLYVAVVLIRDYLLKIELQRTIGILCFIFQFVLAAIISVWSESFFAQIYIFILVGEFTFYQSKVHSLIFTTVSYACCVLSLFIYRQFPPFEQILYLMPRAIEYYAIFGMSLLAKIAFQQKNQLALDNEQLRIASIELERKAKLEERTRISREIHDSVGHTLTSALTGLQAAAHAIEKNNHSVAKDMVNRTKQYILRGLDDVRSSVHLLHENKADRPFVPELIKLIDETKKQTNVEIVSDIDTTMPDLPPMMELTIYRALQEGISNGIRHGSSTYFRFSLTYRSECIRFHLSDNGKPPLHIVHGFGLNAMKERVNEVGGHLSISNNGDSGGITLEITIPFQTKAIGRCD